MSNFLAAPLAVESRESTARVAGNPRALALLIAEPRRLSNATGRLCADLRPSKTTGHRIQDTRRTFSPSPCCTGNLPLVAEHKFSREVENLIAEFRGLPAEMSRSKRRETREVGDVVAKLLRKYRIGLATPEDAIRQAWPEIVGTAAAGFCHPLRIEREKILVIGVSNPVARQELLFHKNTILTRIRALPAAQHIGDILFRVG